MIIKFNLKDNDFGIMMEGFLDNFFSYVRYSYNRKKYDVELEKTKAELDRLTNTMLNNTEFTNQEIDELNERIAEVKSNIDKIQDIQIGEFMDIHKFDDLINPNNDNPSDEDDIEWLTKFIMEKFAMFMHTKHEEDSEYILGNIEITIEKVIDPAWKNGEVYYYETTNRKYLNF